MDEIFIIIGLILLNGVFAMAEIALVSARKSSLQEDAKRGNKAAKTALNLADEPDKFLSTVQIGITLIGILTGIYSGNKIALLLSDKIHAMGLSESYSASLAQFIIILLVTYLTLVFGELLPKRIGMSGAEKVAKIMSRPLLWLSVVASPFVWILSISTSTLLNLLGLKNNATKVTEAEIKSIIQEGAEEGEIQPMEQDIVERVFLMGDLRIGSLMTPRREMVFLNVAMTKEEVHKIVCDELHEMYPVIDNNNDILGIVTLKELFSALSTSDFVLSNHISDVVYLYENISVYKVLENMKIQGFNRGLVCDEFGSCVGIVTLKDLMEGLVGVVNDQDDHQEPQIIKRSNKNEWLVDGQCPIHELLQHFDMEEFYEVNESYTTIAGLCLEILEHIPSAGEKIKWNSLEIEIADMDGARIDKVLVTLNNK